MIKEYFAVRNESEKRNLYRSLKNTEFPFCVVIRNIENVRSVKENSYLWGVVYAYISDYTGHTIEFIHKFYKKLFLQKLEVLSGKLVLTNASTKDISTYMFNYYIERVKAHALLELDIYIPDPNELLNDSETLSLQLKYE